MKAKIGDKVMVTRRSVKGAWYDDKIGEVFTVIDPKDYGFDRDETCVDYKPSEGRLSFISEGNYEIVTLAPSVTDLIANLARRVSELEERAKERAYYETTVAAYEEADADDSADSPKAAQIRQACDAVRDLLIRKNHDYGDSFAQQYAKYGLQSALIRMDDKMRRLETLTDGKQAQVAESIEDTLADLAGYALLALVEARASGE